MAISNDEHRKADLEEFVGDFGIEGVDRELLNLALTHRSFAFENNMTDDNERLEFLGDSLIGFLTSGYLFREYPESDEGTLSKMKSKLVSRSMLGSRAEEMGIGPLLLLGRGEEISGGRQRKTLLGCALESIVGALYISLPLEKVEEFITDNLIRPSEQLLKQDAFADYKSRLQEYVQKKHQSIPEYRVVDETGPDHRKKFFVEAYVLGKLRGTGHGRRKKTAENLAARKALEELQKKG